MVGSLEGYGYFRKKKRISKLNDFEREDFDGCIFLNI